MSDNAFELEIGTQHRYHAIYDPRIWVEGQKGIFSLQLTYSASLLQALGDERTVLQRDGWVTAKGQHRPAVQTDSWEGMERVHRQLVIRNLPRDLCFEDTRLAVTLLPSEIPATIRGRMKLIFSHSHSLSLLKVRVL